ncbi:MAG: hypothetical protein SGBAC_004328 [Bacillariaceae sp.]
MSASALEVRKRYHCGYEYVAVQCIPLQYTKRVMEVLRDEGVLHEAVQIGNEISGGMLWDHRKLPSHLDHSEHLPVQWQNLKDLIQSGIDAVNDAVSDPNARPSIVIHLDTGGDKEFTEYAKNLF